MRMPALPNFSLHCVKAPASWQRIDFISDLHLDANEPETFKAWARYMAQTKADALFILGDLFEVWIGDDNTDPFILQCKDILRAASQRMPVHFMHGNRDFLVGSDFLNSTGIHGLNDPTVLEIPSITQTPIRFLLSHGDCLCLDDQDYLTFRQEVRQPAWQQQFLAKPLAEREAIARHIRSQSEARKKTHTDYADVDTSAALSWLTEANAQVLIHGHTHKPAEHALSPHKTRWVLSDWHADSKPARLDIVSWLQNQQQNPSWGLCRRSLEDSI